jgi:hypothetical protein
MSEGCYELISKEPERSFNPARSDLKFEIVLPNDGYY